MNPTPGSPALTTSGTGSRLGAGGKGLNVAMSVAATGLPSYLVGRVGNDMFGNFIKRALTLGWVNGTSSGPIPRHSPGVGHVRVNAQRDYDTCVMPGANDHVGAGDPHPLSTREHDLPVGDVVRDSVAVRGRRGTPVPGSGIASGDELLTRGRGGRQVLPHTDVLVVNEAEAAALWLQVAGPMRPSRAGCETHEYAAQM